LAAFWIVFVLFVAGGLGVLQFLGPEPKAPATDAKALPTNEKHDESTNSMMAGGPARPSAKLLPPAALPERLNPLDETRNPGSPIPAPEAGLLEPAVDVPGGLLPRIGKLANGYTAKPMNAYAGGFDPHDRRPRVALLLGGLGLSGADTDNAIRQTPPGVTLAFSPYSVSPDIAQARARGHEIVLSIPMEPAGYPLEDEGPQSLLTSASTDANERKLEWVLSRIQGYAGTTGALGDLKGERFARSEEQMTRTVFELTARGLYYIDPQVGGPGSQGASRSVDMVIDNASLSQSIDTNLGSLTRMAVDRGSALGLVGVPRPMTVSRVAIWAEQLETLGVVLVPVSALLLPLPPAQTTQIGATR